MEAGNLGSNGSTNFLVIDSQTETQDWDETRILRNLPAFRQDSPQSPVVELTKTDSVKPQVFLPASDSEFEVAVSCVSESDGVVMETMSDRKSGDSSSREDADVTVIARTDPTRPVEEDRSPPVTGSKEFHLFQASMSENDNSDEEQLVCTPSQYLASLHFSGKALLVPESVEESLNELSASPGPSSDLPVIIPSSPTELRADESDETKQDVIFHQTDSNKCGPGEGRGLLLHGTEVHDQDSLHLALSETSASIMDRETQAVSLPSSSSPGMKQSDVGDGSEPLALQLSLSQDDSVCHEPVKTTEESEASIFQKTKTDSNKQHELFLKEREHFSTPAVAPSLALGVTEASQPTSDASFSLLKPDPHLTESVEESEANIFKKTKQRSDKQHQLVLQESSEDVIVHHSDMLDDLQSGDGDNTELYEAQSKKPQAEDTRDPTSPVEEKNKEEVQLEQIERSVHILPPRSTPHSSADKLKMSVLPPCSVDMEQKEDLLVSSQTGAVSTGRDHPAERSALAQTGAVSTGRDHPAERSALGQTGAVSTGRDHPAERSALGQTGVVSTGQDHPAERSALAQTGAVSTGRDHPAERSALAQTGAVSTGRDHPAERSELGQTGAVSTGRDHPAERSALAQTGAVSTGRDHPAERSELAQTGAVSTGRDHPAERSALAQTGAVSTGRDHPAERSALAQTGAVSTGRDHPAERSALAQTGAVSTGRDHPAERSALAQTGAVSTGRDHPAERSALAQTGAVSTGRDHPAERSALAQTGAVSTGRDHPAERSALVQTGAVSTGRDHPAQRSALAQTGAVSTGRDHPAQRSALAQTGAVSTGRDHPAERSELEPTGSNREGWSTSTGKTPADRARSVTQDPYTFHSSQSQPGEHKLLESSRQATKLRQTPYTQTPVSTKKRTLLHRKSGMKRRHHVSGAVSSTEVEDNGRSEHPPIKRKQPLKKFTRLLQRQMTAKSAEVCTLPATAAALATQSETKLMSPTQSRTTQSRTTQSRTTQSRTTQSRTTQSRTRLMSPTSTTEEGRPESVKLSVEFADTLHSEHETHGDEQLGSSLDSDELIEKTTIVETMQVRKLITVVVMSTRDGRVVKTTQREEKGPDIFLRKVEEMKQLNPFISLSRTNSSLTSGDLADVSSSSLSRQNSSGLKVSSLEKIGISVGVASSQLTNTPEQNLDDNNGTPDLSAIEKTDSRHGAVVSSAESKKTESLFTSPESQRIRVAAVVLSNSSAGKSPMRMLMTGSSEESLGILPGQPSSSHRPPAKPSESSSGSILACERAEQARLSQVSGGFSLHGTAALPQPQTPQSRPQTPQSRSQSPQSRPRSPQSPLVASRSQPVKCESSTDDGHKRSPEIPRQTDSVASDTSAMGTPARRHYASKLEKGAVVMARWRDGFYYPGKISSMDKIKKYKILFDDGDSMLVKVKDILLIKQLPIGQSVMVMSQDGYFECGIVVAHKYDADELLYKVECDDGTSKRCSRSEVILSKDQASCLMSDEELRVTISSPDHVIKNLAVVSLDNLIEGRRRSAAEAQLDKKMEDTTRLTGKQSRGEKSDADATDRWASKKGRSLQAASTPTPGRERSPRPAGGHHSQAARLLTNTVKPPDKSSERTSRKRKPPLTSQSTSPLDGSVESGKSARKSSRKGKAVALQSSRASPSCARTQVFAGMVFLLTHAHKSRAQCEQERRLLQGSPPDTSADENLTDETHTFVFDKDYLRAEIEQGAGMVIDKYNKTQVDAALACYLISDTYQRTIKYIQCLAGGVPCVSHLWVRQSIKQGRALDIKAYILPAGISLQRRKLMEWRQNANCLAGVKVMVTSTNARFVDAWQETLSICKCQIFQRFPGPRASEDEMLDVVIADCSLPSSLRQRARRLGVPVVSTEWVMQCLISGHRVGHDAHPRYRHDFVD